jgi:uncharacterized protein
MKITDVPVGCLVTHSGRVLDYFFPQSESICIEDIAVGLSREFRFANQTYEAYSVAQHSVLVGSLVPPVLALEALLHDATEAYMKDIPAPLKKKLKDYQIIENNLMQVIAATFQIKYPFPEKIKIADHEALKFEWDMLMETRKPDYCWSPRYARMAFLKRYEEIQLAKIKLGLNL